MTSKPIRLVTWNTNGLKQKLTELTHYLTDKDIDIALLTETKLTNADNKIKIKNYHIYRTDRPTHGGGVAIAIKNEIPHVPIDVSHTDLEIVGIKLQNNTNIYSLYIRPYYPLRPQEIDNVINRHSKAIIAGDLNCRHTTWNNHTNNANGLTLHNYVLNNDVNIHYTSEPTHFPPNGSTPTFIDLIINKNVNNLSDPHTDTDLSSDHNPVIFQLKNQHTPYPTPKTWRSYKNTDWDKFRRYITHKIQINNNINNEKQLDEQITKITESLNDAIDKHSQVKTIHSPQTTQLPDNIIKKIREKNATRRAWQQTRDPAIKTRLNQQTTQIKILITEHYNNSWNKTLQNINEDKNNKSRLWKLTKKLKRPLQEIPALKQNGQTYFTDTEKAHIMATKFGELQNNTAHSAIEEEITQSIKSITEVDTQLSPEELASYIATPTEVKNIIRKLPNGKAPGPDNIPNKILKNLPQKGIVQLTYIINSILKLQIFPNQWKNALIIPIYKKQKDKTDPTSYRPISLLNTMAKITEKIIHRRLIEAVEKRNNIIVPEQFGFRAGHSTTMQIVRISNDVIKNYNKQKVTVMTLLDIEKAFDTVWINGLIHKLIHYNIPTFLTKLIYSYLTERTLQVKVKNILSTKQKTKAGVPQGSVLGPVLFNLFINDIPTFPKTSIALYADDTAIYSHSYYAQAALLQNQIHVDKILQYCKKWKIKLNAAKTENITFARKFTNTTTYQRLRILDKTIEPTKAVKYLGVWMDSSLRYHIHAQKTITKFNNALSIFYPLLNRKSRLTMENKKLIYTAVIRPVITYAAPVLAALSTTNKRKLQRLQNKCLRLVLNADRYTRIEELHDMTGLPTLLEYIERLSRNFYEHSMQKSNITRNYNDQPEEKHKLLHQIG